MKKKLIACGLMVAMLMPTGAAFADSNNYTGEGFGKGDYSYEDGMYLPALHYFGVKKGRQVHPFGESKVGKISKEEKLEILARPKVKNLIKAYNSFYQTIIKWYKYGDKRIDRWKEVKNMTDPVFGKLNKEQFLKIYTTGAITLQKVRDYFDYMGLVESDYTYQETLKMIDRSELSFEKIKSCGAEDTLVFNQGITSAKLDAQSKDLADSDGGNLVKKLVENFDGYKIGKPTEVLGKSKAGAYDKRLYLQIYLTRDDSQILFQMAGKDEEIWSDYSLKDKKISNVYGQEMVLSSYKEGGLYRAEFKDLDNEYLVESSGISEDEFLVILRSFIANIRNTSALSSMKLEF
ncbi:hypothetical protein [Anaerococcus sp. Marseille-P3915]|uniref:hypothetical protein n=1 Tax=Anaerococcus sp. Marseille-P3915 TaxID=2057799 RepID=UPI000D0B53F2|nr:hypothetical protein [Anaerococcus sp. Marseille-P3915]